MEPAQYTMTITAPNGQTLYKSTSIYTQKVSLKIGGENKVVDVIKPVSYRKMDCCVCLETVTDPVTMCPSSHLLCRKCAKFEFCPECRYVPKKAGSDGIFPRKDASIESMEMFLKSVPWICPVSCQLSIDHNDLKEHASKCNPYQCSTCSEVKVATNELLSMHESACPEKEIACQKCEMKMKQKDLEEHQSCCPEAVVDVNPKFFAIPGPTVKLKRKVLESLQKISPENLKYLKILYDASTEKPGGPEQNPHHNGQETPVTASSLTNTQQNVRLLAEAEFTAEQVFAKVTGLCRQNLLNFPITPVRSALREIEFYDTISIMLQKITPNRCIPDDPEGFGFICRIINQNLEPCDSMVRTIESVGSLSKKSQPAANKQYTFTLSETSGVNRVTLMQIRQSVNKIRHDNKISDFGNKIFGSLPLDVKNFYLFFCKGFPGDSYLKANPNARLKLTVTEER